MRFAHLSDSHLGYRQLGIMEREEDYYKLFQRTVDKIIELDVDFVIHSGDLFENYRPSADTLYYFQMALKKLNQANIPFYAIVGNHDSRFRKNAKPPLVLFRESGVNLITTKNPFVHENVLICGVPHTKSSNKDALCAKLKALSKLANNYPKSILVLHQGIIGYMRNNEGELTLKELPKNFDYYAMGHLHNYHFVDFGKEENFGNGTLVYPGSMEMQNVKDNPEKGFCVVDISGDKPIVERVLMDLERDTYRIEISYDEFEDTIEEYKSKFQKLDNPPIVDFKVEGGDFDTAELYDIIHEELGDYVLNLRTHLNPTPDDDSGIDWDPNEPLDIKSVLRNKIKEKYDDEFKSKLSSDLLEELSKGNIEGAIQLSNDFFNRYYLSLDDEEKSSDSKVEEVSENKDVDDAISKSNLDMYFRSD